MPQASYLGRRKTSTARLYIKPGKGLFVVNNISIEEYLPVKAMRNIALLPMHITETKGQFDIKVTVRGGGKAGQAGAIQHALARAIDGEQEDMEEPSVMDEETHKDVIVDLFRQKKDGVLDLSDKELEQLLIEQIKMTHKYELLKKQWFFILILFKEFN